MSLAHIKVASLARKARKTPGAPAGRASGTQAVAECGASHEPLYRTADEAGASGLEVCDTCLAIVRKQGRSPR